MSSFRPRPPKRKAPLPESAEGERFDEETLAKPPQDIKPCRRGCRHVSQILPEVLDLIATGGAQ